MGVSETYDFFTRHKINTIFGEAHAFHTIKQICRENKRSTSQIGRDIHILIDKGLIEEHPCNSKIKVKKYKLKQ